MAYFDHPRSTDMLLLEPKEQSLKVMIYSKEDGERFKEASKVNLGLTESPKQKVVQIMTTDFDADSERDIIAVIETEGVDEYSIKIFIQKEGNYTTGNFYGF